MLFSFVRHTYTHTHPHTREYGLNFSGCCWAGDSAVVHHGVGNGDVWCYSPKQSGIPLDLSVAWGPEVEVEVEVRDGARVEGEWEGCGGWGWSGVNGQAEEGSGWSATAGAGESSLVTASTAGEGGGEGGEGGGEAGVSWSSLADSVVPWVPVPSAFSLGRR